MTIVSIRDQAKRKVLNREGVHEILTFAIPVLKDLHKHSSCPRNDALGRFSDIVLVILIFLGQALLDVDLGKSGRDIRPCTPFVAGVDAGDFAAVLLECDRMNTRGSARLARPSYLQNQRPRRLTQEAAKCYAQRVKSTGEGAAVEKVG